jgi:hypothetical protein
VRGGFVGRLPGLRAGEQKALAIIQVFKDAAAPFGLRIAYEDFPPKHLPYSQVMMGGRPEVIGLPPGVLGVACNLDCGDVWWRDTTFAFTEASNPTSASGTTALQEAAHAWGLDHIDGADNIMYPSRRPGRRCGPTAARRTTRRPADRLQATHERFCEPGAQDDVAELTAYFGPNSVDSEAPTVKMLAPQDGQMYTQGDTLRVEVEVDDNFLGFGWRLMVPELKQSLPVYDGRTVWELPVPAMGEYTIRVEALDHDGNVGFAEARVYVDTVPGQTGGDSEAPGDSEGSESTAGEGEDEGCSCRGDVAIRTGSGSASAGLLGLLGALLIRRRRALITAFVGVGGVAAGAAGPAAVGLDGAWQFEAVSGRHGPGRTGPRPRRPPDVAARPVLAVPVFSVVCCSARPGRLRRQDPQG